MTHCTFAGSHTLPCGDGVAKLKHMMKHLSLAVALVLAVGCKTDEPAKPKAKVETQPSRAAKVDIKPVTPRPELPTLPSVPGGDEAATQPAQAEEENGPTHYPVVQTEVPTIDNPPLRDEDEIRGRNVWRKRRRLDLNHDGKVTPDELAATSRKRMEAAHARLDLDGDGKLTADELASTNERLRFDNGEVLDVNRDGNISPDELTAGIRGRREQRAAEAARAEAAEAGAAGTTGTATNTPTGSFGNP